MLKKLLTLIIISSSLLAYSLSTTSGSKYKLSSEGATASAVEEQEEKEETNDDSSINNITNKINNSDTNNININIFNGEQNNQVMERKNKIPREFKPGVYKCYQNNTDSIFEFFPEYIVEHRKGYNYFRGGWKHRGKNNVIFILREKKKTKSYEIKPDKEINKQGFIINIKKDNKAKLFCKAQKLDTL